MLNPVTQSSATAQEPLAVSTQDGLSLGLGGAGDVSGVAVNGRTLPKLPTGGGFSLKLVGEEPNLLPNPSLEDDADGNGVPDGWYLAPGPSSYVDTSTARSGGRSVRFSNPTRGASGALAIEAPVKSSTNYFVTAQFKSSGVLPTSGRMGNPPASSRSGSPLHVRVEQLAGGATVATSYAFGYTDTADWHEGSVGFRTAPGVTAVRLAGMLQDGSGEAWIDDLRLSQLVSDNSIPLAGGVVRNPDGTLTQHAELPDQRLGFDARYAAGPNHISIDASVEDRAQVDAPRTDRAFQVTYSVPLDAVGWRWGDHPRKSRAIAPGVPYAYDVRSTIQPSRYPYAVVYDAQSSLSIGLPLDQPRLARVSYDDARGLSITFDLGVSEAATKLGTRAGFRIVLYTSDPAWGFRSATQKYYEVNPQSFVRRTTPQREGIWFNRAALSQLDRPGTAEDESKAWGLGLNQIALGKDADQSASTWGTGYLRWDNQRGVYASAYNHHWGFFHPRPGCPPATPGCDAPSGTPTYEQAIADLRRDAGLSPTNPAEERLRDEARGALNSTSQDPNGRLRYNTYGRAFLKYFQNPDPDFSTGVDWVSAVNRYQVQNAINLAGSVGARLDGIHLDSTSGQDRWADDYSRAHWALANTPLSFSYENGRVTERLIFAMYEQIRRVSDEMRARGMILSVNFNANEFVPLGWVGADRIDYFGLEEGLPERTAPANGVTTDSFALLKRTLAYQRPVSTLDGVIGQRSTTAAQVETRVQQNLFYGIFPGARGAFWAAPSRRAVYARYTPIFRELASAGWQPVTNARSGDPSVWVERFGSVAGGNLYLTIRNETNVAHSYSLVVDLDRDGLPAVEAAAARELVGGADLPLALNGPRTQATIATTIAPRSTQVVRLHATADRTPPDGTVTIGDAWRYTRSRDVPVHVPAQDAGSAGAIAEVRLSNRRDMQGAVSFPYSSPIRWRLGGDAAEAPDGRYRVYAQWRDYSGNWSRVRWDGIILDTGQPVARIPAPSLLAPGQVDTSASPPRVPVHARWSGYDRRSGIGRFVLQQSSEAGPYADVALPASARAATLSLDINRTHRLRTSAMDGAGNWSPWNEAPVFALSVVQETNVALRYGGTWRKGRRADAFNRQLRYSTERGGRVRLTFRGRGVAWVGTAAPKHGVADVYVDGERQRRVDLYSATRQPRRVVWARTWTAEQRHTVEIVVRGTKGRPRVDVDAFVVMRSE